MDVAFSFQPSSSSHSRNANTHTSESITLGSLDYNAVMKMLFVCEARCVCLGDELYGVCFPHGVGIMNWSVSIEFSCYINSSTKARPMSVGTRGSRCTNGPA